MAARPETGGRGPHRHDPDDLAGVESAVSQILLVASAGDVAFDRVPSLRILLYDATVADAEPLAYFDVKPETGEETALICGELYRRGGGWKFRALGEGYVNGLEGLATNFGIMVDETTAAGADQSGTSQPPSPETSAPLPPEQPPAGVPSQPGYGYPPAAPTQPSQPAYGYPHPQPTPATTNGPAYGYPQHTAAALDPDFRLPPQGPQFIGR